MFYVFLWANRSISVIFLTLKIAFMIMITKQESWLFAALFVLLGVFSTQAQDDVCMKLEVQHYESDYVPAVESDYFRNFITIKNVDPDFLSLTLTPDQISDGYNSFILYRYPALNPGDAVKTPVAKLTLTLADEGVDYEITYMNQEPLPDYDLELVTQGTLSVIEGLVDMEDIVLVDQLRVAIVEDDSYMAYFYGDEGEFDPSTIYYWTPCVYVMALETDPDWATNSVDVPNDYRANMFVLGNYSMDDIEQDYFNTRPTLKAGMKNAYFEVNNLRYSEKPEITGFTILRGDNTYPQDVISYQVRIDDHPGFLEQSHALPEYYGTESDWQIVRNDTSLAVLGTYNDYMTYVPVTRVNGDDRVKKDGENTYGGMISKTGVAGLDAEVNGGILDDILFQDDQGVDCTIFEPHFGLTLTMPDYATDEYVPRWFEIFVKSDNVRGFEIDDDGNAVYDPYSGPDSEGYMYLYDKNIDYGHWDDDAQEFVIDFTGQLSVGGDDSWCGFAATCSTVQEGVTFLIRFWYEHVVAMPWKIGDYPSYCVVEKEIPWVIVPSPTGVNEMGSGTEVGKTYYNLQGIASDTPYDGMNIVVTHYSDGTTKSTKVMR